VLTVPKPLRGVTLNFPGTRALSPDNNGRTHMLRLVLLIVLILLLLGSVPLWPYSASWGYGPSGGLGLVLLIVLILILVGRL
ncbi:MAG TPA: DUF3309 family protein, partial [Rhizomicrobium sp.]|nr:DUF3309 family protein [Rhizomicrobium sp.]